MKDRKGHYLAERSRAAVPAVIFGVSVNAKLSVRPNMPHVTIREWYSAGVCVIYRKRSGWTHPETSRHGTPASMREWMQSHSLAGRINWVVCPNAGEVLTLSKWWDYVSLVGSAWRNVQGNREGTGADYREGVGVVFDRLTVTSDRQCVRYAERGVTWCWCGIGNWFGADEGTGGGSVRAGPVHQVGSPPVGSACASGSVIEAIDCATRLAGLCDWWRDNGGAAFGVTVGALAVGCLRAHCPPRTLCTHSDPDAHALERAASFGGRASVWYVGAIGDGCGLTGAPFGRYERAPVPTVAGPVTQVDVRSMYASIMRDEEVPTKLIGVRENVTVKEMIQLCQRFGVIARVRIRTDRGEYPLRRADRVLYPVGELVTTLTGPELIRLATHGEILECQTIASYHRSSVLSAFASWGLSELTRAASANDASSRSFLKRMLNSLCGKLAQRSGRWVRSPSDDERNRWGDGYSVSRETGKVVRLKYLAGICWRYDEDANGAGPHTAAFAYIAALGRLRMRSVRESLPARAVVSQDTDGLWILGSDTRTLDMLGGLVGGEPGQLRIVASGDNARFLGPRHYCVDGSWVLSGFHAPTVEAGGATVWDIVFPSLWGTKTHHPPTRTAMIARKSRLPLDVSGGRVQADGWVLPPHILPRKS